MSDQSPLTVRIVGNVRRLREELGWSTRQLAETVKVMSRSTLANLENGRRSDITVDELFLLADALSTTTDYLANYSGPRCTQCLDEPPAGYSCITCGATNQGEVSGG